MSHNSNQPAFLFILLFPTVTSFFLYWKYAGLRVGPALLVWVLTVASAGAVLAWRISHVRFQNNEMAIASVSAAACILLLLPFLAKLHGKWIDGRLTESERAPGAVGFRAWLSLGNILIAALISVTAWYGFGIGFPLMLLLTIGALAFWPLMNTRAATAGTTTEPVSENLSAEREKVLSLLEAGKITAEESTELLNALGATRTAPRSSSAQLSFGRKLVLVGSGLVLIGFFLPWFTVSPMAELNAAFDQMRQSFPMAQAAIPDGLMPASALGKVVITGGSVGHGLGWITLLLTLSAGLLPYMITGLNGDTLRRCRLLALAGGTIILLYLVTQDFRLVSIGLVVALAGCALQWAGLLDEQRAV